VSIDESHQQNGSEPIENGSPPHSTNILVNTTIHPDGEMTVVSNGSSSIPSDGEGPQPSPTHETGFNKFKDQMQFSKLKDQIPINKFKDQISQRAKNVMTKTESLTSMFEKPPPPPVLDQVYWTEVRIERGKDLAPKDISGTSDPYVKVLYGSEEKYMSAVVESNLNPVWNETFTFFTHDLNVPLCFQIFDRDRIGRDESMGSTKLDLWKLPFERLYCATLDLEDEKRSDGIAGMLKVGITITPKSIEFRDEVKIKHLNIFYLIFLNSGHAKFSKTATTAIVFFQPCT
jgi:hypothetical protein